MKIFLLRHGETKWNHDSRMQGWSDTPLNELGKKQAKERAELLAGEKINAIYSSDLSRAVETAEAVAIKHKLKVIKRKEIREIYIGDFEGLCSAEAREKHTDFYGEREKKRFSLAYPGGESSNDLRKRVFKFVEEIKKKHANDTIVITAHNGSNKAIIGCLLGLKPKEYIALDSSNDSIWEIDLEKKTAVMKVEGKEVKRI